MTYQQSCLFRAYWGWHCALRHLRLAVS